MKLNLNKVQFWGSSLIELLVVISIIAILTITMIPTIASFNKIQNLNQATENVAVELRTLRDKALSGAVYDPDGSATRVWWGLKCNGSNYQLGYSSDNGSNSPSNSFTVVQTKKVSDLASITLNCSQNQIFFKRLTGELYYSSGSGAGITDNINITVSNGSATKTIALYKTGKIVVQ